MAKSHTTRLCCGAKVESSGQAGEYLALSIVGDYIAMFVKRKVPTAGKNGKRGLLLLWHNKCSDSKWRVRQLQLELDRS